MKAWPVPGCTVNVTCFPMFLSLASRARAAAGAKNVSCSAICPLIDAVIDDDPRDYGYRATVWTAPLLQRSLEEAHGIETSRILMFWVIPSDARSTLFSQFFIAATRVAL